MDIQYYRSLVEKRLEELIQEKPSAYHHSLFEAARYSLFSSGKRLRPLLAIAVALDYQAELEEILDAASALECIHTYSLIHDDLPCMDNDDFRRGKPTLHKVVSEGNALLTGDFFLTFAFQILCEAPILSPQKKLSLIHCLAKNAGSEGMIGGQVIDLSSEGKEIDWKTLKFMHLGKTAALMTCSLLFGAIVGNAPKSDIELLTEIGQYLGLAFQCQDDLLDTDQDSSSYASVKSAKATAPSILGIKATEEKIKEFLSDLNKNFNLLSRPTPLLQSLIKIIIKIN